MDTLIGILELIGWIVAVLVLAAVVTYAVIKLTNVWQARRQAEAGRACPQAGRCCSCSRPAGHAER